MSTYRSISHKLQQSHAVQLRNILGSAIDTSCGVMITKKKY